MSDQQKMGSVCYLCGGSEMRRRPGHCRDAVSIYPLECSTCGLVRLSEQNLARDAAYYADSRMRDEDNLPEMAEVVDEMAEDDTLRRLALLQEFDVGGRLLDFGCGEGRVLKAVAQRGVNVAGVEPERRMQHLLQQKGILCWASMDDMPREEKFDCITLFHVLEHLVDPLDTLVRLQQHLVEHGKMFIEVPSASDALLTRYDVPAFTTFTYWSCHLYLFTPTTLQTLLERAGFRQIHIHPVQRYGLANHMGWLTQGKPTGLRGSPEFAWLHQKELNTAYARHLGEHGCTDTLVAECVL